MWKIKCLPSHLQMQTYLSGFFVYFQIFVRNAFMFFGPNMSQVDLTSFSFLFKIKSVTDTVDVNNFTTNNLISYYLFHIMKEQINFGIHYLWNTQNLWSDRLSPTEREMEHVVITGRMFWCEIQKQNWNTVVLFRKEHFQCEVTGRHHW